IATWEGGLVNFDGIDWTVYDHTNSGMPYIQIRSLAIDNNDTKWIGTPHKGLAVFNENGIPLSIKESTIPNVQFYIYPNPSKGYFTIECTSKLKIYFLEIYNFQGSLIKTESVIENNEIIDISDYPSGIYTIKIKTEHGIGIKKLIKH
ncbi:MAG: hypothetical protein DRJ10_19900, partial [Bacteroidetes bacterium]